VGKTKPVSCTLSSAFGQRVAEQQFFRRQCDHAESGWLPTLQLSSHQLTADL
jgi:hypothetical protein